MLRNNEDKEIQKLLQPFTNEASQPDQRFKERLYSKILARLEKPTLFSFSTTMKKLSYKWTIAIGGVTALLLVTEWGLGYYLWRKSLPKPEKTFLTQDQLLADISKKPIISLPFYSKAGGNESVSTGPTIPWSIGKTDEPKLYSVKIRTVVGPKTNECGFISLPYNLDLKSWESENYSYVEQNQVFKYKNVEKIGDGIETVHIFLDNQQKFIRISYLGGDYAGKYVVSKDFFLPKNREEVPQKQGEFQEDQIEGKKPLQISQTQPLPSRTYSVKAQY